MTDVSNPTNSFHVEIKSSPMAVRDALTGIKSGLKPLALEQEELGSVELVLAEALNNVVEHAYPDGDAPGLIEIDCDRRANGLHFRVVDYGRPMPDGKAPIGQQANLDVDMPDLPEGGFGWFLIQDIAKEVEYARKGACNILDLRLAVAMDL